MLQKHCISSGHCFVTARHSHHVETVQGRVTCDARVGGATSFAVVVVAVAVVVIVVLEVVVFSWMWWFWGLLLLLLLLWLWCLK